MNTQEMLEKFSNDKVHAKEVERLALMIFDNITQKKLTEKERQYLQSASLLHDIGYYIDPKSHNKHSQQMILQYGLDEFDEREKQIISCICRYHRGSLPDKYEHEIYCNLDKHERKTVKRLAGILKIADNLDSNHAKLIDKIRMNYDEENNITEIIITARDFRPEINYTKRDLFEIGFKTQVIFKFE